MTESERPSESSQQGIKSLIERVKPHLDPALKALNVGWFLSLSVGALIFIVYYSFSISFFPDLDLQDAITLLASTALLGVFMLLWLAAILLLPGWMFVRKDEHEKHQVF